MLDQEKRIIGVLAGCPDGLGWQEVCSRAFSILQRMAKRVQPNQDELESRRGIGKYVSYGISLGNGQKVSTTHYLFTLYVVLTCCWYNQKPHWLNQTSARKSEVVDSLISCKSIQQICKFASCKFSFYHSSL